MRRKLLTLTLTLTLAASTSVFVNAHFIPHLYDISQGIIRAEKTEELEVPYVPEELILLENTPTNSGQEATKQVPKEESNAVLKAKLEKCCDEILALGSISMFEQDMVERKRKLRVEIILELRIIKSELKGDNFKIIDEAIKQLNSDVTLRWSKESLPHCQKIASNLKKLINNL